MNTDTITIRVRDRQSENATWGQPGLFSPHIRTISLPRYTNQGERRSDPTPLNQHEDGVWFSVDNWTLDSGRVESYAEALKIARDLAVRP